MRRFRKTVMRQLGAASVGIYAIIAFSTNAMGQSNARLPAAQQQTITYAPGEVYLESSRVFVYVGKTGFGHEHGVVGRIKQGAIQLGAAQDAGQLIFDMASFEADTDTARNYVGLTGTTDDSTKQQVDANMRGAGVLNIEQYPTASFAIKSSQLLTENSQRGLPQYRFDGTFTLHGIAQPISIIADAEQKDGWFHLRGGFALLQTSYGITPFSKAFGAVGITDQLKVWGDIWVAGPQGATATVSLARKK